jgi:bacterioferritin-associated ferredoxin
MYVCICNGYRDSELRELASSGVACAIEAYHTLGGGPCCGRCVPTAQQIIDETRGRPLAPHLAVAAE